jgi:hypothetical protein
MYLRDAADCNVWGGQVAMIHFDGKRIDWIVPFRYQY